MNSVIRKLSLSFIYIQVHDRYHYA